MNAAQKKELNEQRRGIRVTGERLQGLIRDHMSAMVRYPELDAQRERLGVANHDLSNVLLRVYSVDVEKKQEVKPL
jgi:hypothetical protein